MKKDFSSLKTISLWVIIDLFLVCLFMFLTKYYYEATNISTTMALSIAISSIALAMTWCIEPKSIAFNCAIKMAIMANLLALLLITNINIAYKLIVGIVVIAAAITYVYKIGKKPTEDRISKKILSFSLFAEFILIAFPIFLVNFFLVNPLSMVFFTGLSFVVLGITTLVLLYDILVAEHGFSSIFGVIAILAAIIIEIFAGYCNLICGVIIALWVVSIIIAIIYEILAGIGQGLCPD